MWHVKNIDIQVLIVVFISNYPPDLKYMIMYRYNAVMCDITAIPIAESIVAACDMLLKFHNLSLKFALTLKTT